MRSKRRRAVDRRRARRDACSPLTPRSTMSSACRSGTFVSSSVTGGPATRSPLTMVVPPRRAHSARIWRDAARSARSGVTRPSWNSSLTGPPRTSRRRRAAGRAASTCSIFMESLALWVGQYTAAAVHAAYVTSDTAHGSGHQPQARYRYVCRMCSITRRMMSSSPSLRLVADERADLRDVGHPPRHVLESRFVGLVVRDVLNRRLRCRSAS